MNAIANLPAWFNKRFLRKPIELGLQVARQKAQGQDISFCGFAQCWEDCFNGWWQQDEQKMNLLFHYNIGKATHAVAMVLIIKNGHRCPDTDIICQLR